VGLGETQLACVLHDAADAAAFFDHVLGDAFAAVGAFDEGPDVVFAFAAGAGEEDIGGSFCGDEFVRTTWEFDYGDAGGETVHDVEHMADGAAKGFFAEFVAGAGAEKKKFVEGEPGFAGDHHHFAGFARHECAAQESGQTSCEPPIAKPCDAVEGTNVCPHGAGEDFRIEVVEAREFRVAKA
jgi:hypothetical protein